MISPKELIEAKQKGTTFSRILHAITNRRSTISKLPQEQLDLLESHLLNINASVLKLEEAFKTDNLNTIDKISKSIIETCEMLSDTVKED